MNLNLQMAAGIHWYWIMVVDTYPQQCFKKKKKCSITFHRWALCESVGSAKRRPATGVSEEPSQNCHKFVSQHQRPETAVSFPGQVRSIVRMSDIKNKETFFETVEIQGHTISQMHI